MDTAIIILTSVFCFLAVVAFFNGILKKNWEAWDKIFRMVRVMRSSGHDSTKEQPKIMDDNHPVERKIT